MRRHWITWPAGLVGVAAYLVVFLRARLYADTGLQVVFFAQGLYGWWAWARRPERAEVPVRAMRPRARLGVALGTAAAAAIVGALLAARTDAAAPWADAALSVTSLVANLLLARRLVENWVLWILVDVGYVALFLVKGLAVSAGLYVVFLVMAAIGLRDWMRALHAAPSA